MTESGTITQDWMRWAGYAVSGLVILFMLMDAIMKLARVPVSVRTTAQLGWAEGAVPALGWILLISTVLYAIPHTSVIGAILLTGYLGGAIATQARVGNPMLSHVFFGVYLGVMTWIGLYLLNENMRVHFPSLW